MVIWNITTIGLWVEGQIGNRTILVEVNIQPHFDTSDIKINFSGIILDIHQKLAPALIGPVNIVIEQSNKNLRMLL